MSDLPPIQAWVEHLSTTLGLDPTVLADPATLRAVLDATRDVAHHVDRPAAPVSALLVGLAAARDGGDASAVRATAEQAARAARLWEQP